MTHELRAESKNSGFGQLGGKKGLLGKERPFSLVFRNAEGMPGLSLGLMFVMEVCALGATE